MAPAVVLIKFLDPLQPHPPDRLLSVNSDAPQGPSIHAEPLAKSPDSAEWWVVSCGGAIINIVMIDRTIAITLSLSLRAP